jgi:hypothetical protein
MPRCMPSRRCRCACARGLSPEALAEQSGAQLAAELEVKLLARTWAIELDRARQRLLTTRGTLRYQHLIIASGARARRIDLAGAGASRLFSVNDLQALCPISGCVRAGISPRPPGAASGAPADRRCRTGRLRIRQRLRGLGAQVCTAGQRPLADPVSSGQGCRRAAARCPGGTGRLVRWRRAAVACRTFPRPRPPVLVWRAEPAPDAVEAARVTLDWTSACGTPRTQSFDLGLMATGIEPETRLASRAGLACRTCDPGRCAHPGHLRSAGVRAGRLRRDRRSAGMHDRAHPPAGAHDCRRDHRAAHCLRAACSGMGRQDTVSAPGDPAGGAGRRNPVRCGLRRRPGAG